MKKRLALLFVGVTVLWVLHGLYWAHMEDEHQGEF
jgi:hypothetical protein